jgi:quercetin dioxygenase-like cupin family protein
MIHRHLESAFADERGAITDVLEGEEVEHVTVIDSLPGSVRGNHFHRETYQWVYVVSGAFRYVVEGPDCGYREGTARAGDLLLTEPMEKHALKALEPSTMVVLTRGPRGGRKYEADTFRLEEPLIPVRS